MIDTTLSTFDRDVLEASLDVPVIVDFWAPWCAPSQAMAPMLERLEREYGGRFRLVNVNADTNPELVSSFDLKSLPHAVAFVDGCAVAQFIGAQPEAFVRAFVDRLVPNPSHLEHRCAREAMLTGEIDVAERYLRNAIALDPSNDAARLDMVEVHLDRGEVATAQRHYHVLSSRAPQQSRYAVIAARLECATAVLRLPPVEELERRLARDPADLRAHMDLADHAVAMRDFPLALGHLLEIVRRDRNFEADAGRLRMIAVFEMAGEFPELVAEYRNRLARILY